MYVANSINRLRCPVCHRYYLKKYIAVLDEYKSVIHGKCYDKKADFNFTDYGTYQELIEKYYFFEELRIFNS